ncbi:TlpA disulfide reductase family protein [uncultured Aquimarina sp.]|uniref:TlpA family protein disulfide reductase n=1 Tax=uncultured Aquimarina sp. TaxID=575652 RepID=UPI0026147249|nr:TlpA disulfide reductase family protein [uncultured Aquimarina sp.]
MKTILPFLLVVVLGCFSCNKAIETKNTKTEQSEIASISDEQKLEMVEEGKQVGRAIITKIDSTLVETDAFKGKLLVIDFWATWCSPCIKEAPMFKQIAKKYKDENVTFISISIDSDFSNWKEYVTENSWEGNNYWYGRFNKDSFAYLIYSKFNVKDEEVVGISLPKYVIISPEGKILSNADLRPSKPGFETEIKKYL